MNEQELKKFIGQRICYEIPPHFGWKKRMEGVGVLDYYKEQGWWQILMHDGTEFLLHDFMLDQIEFDRDEDMLSFIYMP